MKVDMWVKQYGEQRNIALVAMSMQLDVTLLCVCCGCYRVCMVLSYCSAQRYVSLMTRDDPHLASYHAVQ